MAIQKPDFSHLGYQVNKELGKNRFGGRITHLAEVENAKIKVVIKEFRFANIDTEWSGFKAYEREIEVLKQLEHPRIPSYLTTFETQQGFCLVQEYKDAPSLASENKFTPQQIKQIAISVLEILVYLQQRKPKIIHRDIKPENILVDKNLNAYLVDFGFAKVHNNEVAMSSVASGTPGFIPPEEYFGRDLTEASDLYSLGVTLICLLTKTRSVDVGKLIDEEYRFNFKSLPSELHPQFVRWLRKMVEPNIKNRFANAAEALEALKPISVTVKSPEVKTPTNSLTFVQCFAILMCLWLGSAGMQIFQELSISQRRQNRVLARQQQELIDTQEGRISRLLNKQEELEDRLDRVNRVNQQQARTLRRLQSKINRRESEIAAQRRHSGLLSRLQKTKECNNCNFYKADLNNVQLEKVSLKNANLKYSKLANANLQNSNLSNANLGYAGLENTTFKNTNFQNANLRGAKLRNAVLAGANLSNANLMYAKLNNADLRGADLRGVQFRYTKLDGADLRGANLQYTNLDGVKLTNVKLTGAIMPDGSKHP